MEFFFINILNFACFDKPLHLVTDHWRDLIVVNKLISNIVLERIVHPLQLRAILKPKLRPYLFIFFPRPHIPREVWRDCWAHVEHFTLLLHLLLNILITPRRPEHHVIFAVLELHNAIELRAARLVVVVEVHGSLGHRVQERSDTGFVFLG